MAGVGTKPSAAGLSDISKEAADTVLHISPLFLPLFPLPQHAEGDFFPVPPGAGRQLVLGAHLAGRQKVVLLARYVCCWTRRSMWFFSKSWEGIKRRAA